MRHIVANGVLVRKMQYILFRVIILLAKVKDRSQLAVLFENTSISMAWCTIAGTHQPALVYQLIFSANSSLSVSGHLGSQ